MKGENLVPIRGQVPIMESPTMTHIRYQRHEDGSLDSIQRFVVFPGLDYIGIKETQKMDGGNILLDEKRNQLVGEAEFYEKNLMKYFLFIKQIEVLAGWR
jgi:hypothetical protein